MHGKANDLNALNKQIHRQLLKYGVNISSDMMVGDNVVIRSCFLGGGTDWYHADDLVNEVIDIGNKIMFNNG